MSGLTESLIYIIQTLGQLYLLIVVLRFVLQLVRADFYNPLCQFTVKATQPLLAPLRRLIPSVAGLDLAGLVLAVLLQLILISSILAISGVDVLQLIPNILAWSLIAIGSIFLKIFFFALIISVILSWVAPGSHNPGAQLTQQITEPMLAPIRNLLPNLGGLDISPIFAFIAINLLERLVITNLAVSTGLTGPIRALVSPFL
ncbi:YggT family protein [Pseudomonas sp. C27(2019)]|uniref:YggT family protein n=1 Tax=Pseudomonas sp. C27(2019) TaxID=2604941 RepID=UPI0012459429|nr:YggT family protein [Pseudomonas sp. C27(2019)]QEY57920.1 YggT family protein [Pseudomonas sp. C27(2019)]